MTRQTPRFASGPNRKTFPMLYKLSSTGAVQQWEISVDDSAFADVSLIITTWGQVGGQQQTTTDQVAKGKNEGRSNATTHRQQAELEAESQWEKKLKKGYVKDLKGAKAGEVDSIIEGGISPMLAHRFDEDGHKINYPCFTQPKLDGHRCIAIIDAVGHCTLWSRTRKPITSMTHIMAAIESLGLHSTILDGELYNHAYKNKFEKLTSFIRKTDFVEGADVVQYHIYDLPSSWGFEQRWGFLQTHLGSIALPAPLKLVETYKVADEDELMLSFNRFLEEGFEGAMARNAAGAYVNKRSYDLLKIKEFADAEFEVIGVEEGRGKLIGHAIFVCKTSSGVEFRTKLKGKTEDLKQYWDNPALAIGRKLTVKYQGLTNANGVPRFPVAERFREDI